MNKPKERLKDTEYLRDLAQRLMHVPAIYGTDQFDVERLYLIASNIEKAQTRHFAAFSRKKP